MAPTCPNPAKISNCILKLLYDSDFMPKSSLTIWQGASGSLQNGLWNGQMGLEAFQISTCYKMACHGKMISYKMTHRSYMGLEAYHFRKEISTGMHKAVLHRAAFAHRYLYTQTLLHGEALSQWSFATLDHSSCGRSDTHHPRRGLRQRKKIRISPRVWASDMHNLRRGLSG